MLCTVAPSSCASAAVAPSAPWSAPAAVTGCSGASPATVGYPSSSPTTVTGPGAIVCANGAGDLALAPLVGGAPGAISAITPQGNAAAPAPTAPFATTTTGDGRVVVAASTAGGAGQGAIVTEGGATSQFGPALALHGPVGPLSLARAYLGDTAVASIATGPHATTTVRLRMQRHFQTEFGRPIVISAMRGPITALDVTLDYRSDALVAWEQGGSIWARELRATGDLWPLQRLGSSRPHPQLQALVSDDYRAIVTWASSAATRTHIWISISAPRVRFSTRPRLVEAFSDAPGSTLPDGSLRLVRLSTEGVVLAFTGKENDRHVVRAAAVALDGVRAITTVSDPATDSFLADLATGPRSDVVAAWTATTAAGRRELYAARGAAPHSVATFRAPERIASLGAAHPGVAVAIDPSTDGAIAAWQDGRRIAWSARTPS